MTPKLRWRGARDGSPMHNYSSEASDPHCLGPGDAEALLAAAPWKRLLVMGDSIAARHRRPG